MMKYLLVGGPLYDQRHEFGIHTINTKPEWMEKVLGELCTALVLGNPGKESKN